MSKKRAPDTARTCDLRIRSPLLYPTELQAHFPFMPKIDRFTGILKNSVSFFKMPNKHKRKRVGDGVRTHDNQIHNLALYH